MWNGPCNRSDWKPVGWAQSGNRTEDSRWNKTGVFLLIVTTVKQLPGSVVVMCEENFFIFFSDFIFLQLRKSVCFPAGVGAEQWWRTLCARLLASFYLLGNTFSHFEDCARHFEDKISSLLTWMNLFIECFFMQCRGTIFIFLLPCWDPFQYKLG